MARTKTSGIYTDADGTKVADKWLDGERIYKRLGSVTHEQASSGSPRKSSSERSQIRVDRVLELLSEKQRQST